MRWRELLVTLQSAEPTWIADSFDQVVSYIYEGCKKGNLPAFYDETNNGIIKINTHLTEEIE